MVFVHCYLSSSHVTVLTQRGFYRYAGEETPYRKLFREFHLKKKRLAADEWGADPSTVADIFVPVEQWIMKEAPHFAERYPPMWTPTHFVVRCSF